MYSREVKKVRKKEKRGATRTTRVASTAVRLRSFMSFSPNTPQQLASDAHLLYIVSNPQNAQVIQEERAGMG